MWAVPRGTTRAGERPPPPPKGASIMQGACDALPETSDANVTYHHCQVPAASTSGEVAARGKWGHHRFTSDWMVEMNVRHVMRDDDRVYITLIPDQGTRVLWLFT
jgi:hypothetical protein